MEDTTSKHSLQGFNNTLINYSYHWNPYKTKILGVIIAKIRLTKVTLVYSNSNNTNMRKIYIYVIITAILAVYATSGATQKKQTKRELRKEKRLNNKNNKSKEFFLNIIRSGNFEFIGVLEFELPTKKIPSKREEYKVLTIKDKMLFHNDGIGTPDFNINITFDTRKNLKAKISAKGFDITLYEESSNRRKIVLVDNKGKYVGRIKAISPFDPKRLNNPYPENILDSFINLEKKKISDSLIKLKNIKILNVENTSDLRQ